MKQFLSLFIFGIGAVLFLAFFTTLKPTVVTAVSGPGKPHQQCSTKTQPFCGSLTFATARWSGAERPN